MFNPFADNRPPSDKFVSNFAKEHLMEEDKVRDLINNSDNWKKTLDETAFDRVKKGISTQDNKDYSKLLQSDLDTTNMRNMKTREILGYNDLVRTDRMKAGGFDLRGAGAESGFGSSVAQARNASFGTRLNALGETLKPFSSSNINSVKESFGFISKDSKIMAAKGSMMTKIMRKGMIPGFTALSAYSALQEEDSLNSFMTMSMGTWGLQQGWRVGKASADVLGKPSHWKRIPIGGAMSLGLGAVAAGSMWALGDLGKNDSSIAKMSKKVYAKEAFAKQTVTQESLTMRRAALNKLSSSSLNNRGQLLGNEATILRSAQY